MDIETVLEEVGEGTAQRAAICCLFLTTFVEGFLSSGIFYFLPKIACDLMVPWTHLSLAYLPFLFGEVFGSYFLGGMSDVNGRRYTLNLCSASVFVASFVASTAGQLILLDVVHFFLGFILAGFHWGSRILTFEILPSSHRSSRLIGFDIVYTVGSMFAVVMAHSTINEPLSSISIVHLRCWRLMYTISGILGMIGAAFVCQTTISPKQMLVNKRLVSATIVLRKYNAINKSVNEDAYINHQIIPFKYVEDRAFRSSNWSDCVSYFFKSLRDYSYNIFKRPFLTTAILLFFIHFLLFDGSTMLHSLMREIFTSESNECVVVGGRAANETNSEEICMDAAVSPFLYDIFFNMTAIVALVALFFFIDRTPRKIIFAMIAGVACTLSGCGCLAAAYPALPNALSFTVIIILTSSNAISSSVIKILTMECFPTKFRATALGTFGFIGRLTNIGIFLSSYALCAYVMISLGVTFFGLEIICVQCVSSGCISHYICSSQEWDRSRVIRMRTKCWIMMQHLRYKIRIIIASEGGPELRIPEMHKLFESERSCYRACKVKVVYWFESVAITSLDGSTGVCTTMGLTLYSVSDGPPSLAVRMALKFLDLDFKLVEVDFAAGQHMTSDYAKLNPQKEIPVLEDNGFYLSESVAILQYLADKYKKNESLYPSDPQLRAIINHRLAFNLSTYYRSISEYVMAPIFFGYERTPLGLKKVEVALDVFNTYLQRLDKQFSTSDNLTIADFPLVTATLCLEAIGFDLTPYPQVRGWYNRFKQEFPDLWSIGEVGMKKITDFNSNPPDLSGLNHPIHPVKKIK